jgi:hypothetical protein
MVAGCPTSQDVDLGGGDGGTCDPERESCPEPATCDTFTAVGEFQLCAKPGATSYTVVVKYTGGSQIATIVESSSHGR